MKNKIKIVIADDNKFFCEALKDSLNLHEEFHIKNTFTSIKEVINFTNKANLDVLILDVNFNGVNSLDFIEEIKNKNKFKIIILTTLNNNFIKTKSQNKGVDAFIGKDSDFSKFKEVIIATYLSNEKINNNKNFKINIGNISFTKRKIEILSALYIYSNKKEKELSAILNISESSLKTHKRELFEITNTNNTPELIKFGIQNGLIIT